MAKEAQFAPFFIRLPPSPILAAALCLSAFRRLLSCHLKGTALHIFFLVRGIVGNGLYLLTSDY